MAVLSQLVSIPRIYISLFVILLTIFIIIKFYYYKRFICLLNKLTNKKSNSEFIRNQILELGMPKDLLDKINDLGDKEKNFKCIYNYIGNTQDNNKFLDKIKLSNNKHVIVFLGENGAGKTTSLFSIFNYLKTHCNVVLSSIDFYKKAFDTFQFLVEENNAEYIAFKHHENFKSAYRQILKKFNESEYSILLLDTSGKNMQKHNLTTETENFIMKFKNMCYELGIKDHFVYLLNTETDFNQSFSKILDVSDFVVLSHINLKNFYVLYIIKVISYSNNILGYLDEALRFKMFNKTKICLQYTEFLIQLFNNK